MAGVEVHRVERCRHLDARHGAHHRGGDALAAQAVGRAFGERVGQRGGERVVHDHLAACAVDGYLAVQRQAGGLQAQQGAVHGHVLQENGGVGQVFGGHWVGGLPVDPRHTHQWVVTARGDGVGAVPTHDAARVVHGAAPAVAIDHASVAAVGDQCARAQLEHAHLERCRLHTEHALPHAGRRAVLCGVGPQQLVRACGGQACHADMPGAGQRARGCAGAGGGVPAHAQRAAFGRVGCAAQGERESVGLEGEPGEQRERDAPDRCDAGRVSHRGARLRVPDIAVCPRVDQGHGVRGAQHARLIKLGCAARGGVRLDHVFVDAHAGGRVQVHRAGGVVHGAQHQALRAERCADEHASSDVYQGDGGRDFKASLLHRGHGQAHAAGYNGGVGERVIAPAMADGSRVGDGCAVERHLHRAVGQHLGGKRDASGCEAARGVAAQGAVGAHGGCVVGSAAAPCQGDGGRHGAVVHRQHRAEPGGQVGSFHGHSGGRVAPAVHDGAAHIGHGPQ